ncbi:response regulator [Chitinimonas lacunae]|uniref:Response regulator n=1 Tax=Chitinimonas lacunae TaxID=1963018 RepID=A0ABV8MVA0_9NEIS
MIADDHSLVRVGILTLVGQLGRFEVVGEAVDGNAALAMILARQPDIALMDINMPGLSGIEVAERLRSAGSQTRLIILSGNEERDTVLAALKAGTQGYLVKDLLLAELEIALDAVYRGNHYLSPRVAGHVIASAAHSPPPQSPARSSLLLTPRQLDVLQAVVRGLSTKQIARELQISPKTVEFHRAQLSERLGVHDVASLIKQATRLGLLSLD